MNFSCLIVAVFSFREQLEAVQLRIKSLTSQEAPYSSIVSASWYYRCFELGR